MKVGNQTTTMAGGEGAMTIPEGRNGSEERPARPEQFLYPLQFIFTEHDRQRVLCAALERLADDPEAADARENAAAILAYLEKRMPNHLADEEDLFPLLMRRGRPDDEVEAIVAQLRHEHEADAEYVRRVTASLKALAAGHPLAEASAFVHDARAFSIFQRRHLAWENGILLPLAEKRLARRDLVELGRKMAARRGLNYPG